ncbi:PIN domain-containing protein [Planomonospora algeriensis]
MRRLTGLRRFVFDTGALVGLERGNPDVIEVLERILAGELEGVVPRTVLAEAGRDGTRRVRLAAAFNRARRIRHGSLVIDELTPERAMEIGKKIGECGHDDVVDVNVALCARSSPSGVVDAIVLTGDRDGITRVDGALEHVIIDV